MRRIRKLHSTVTSSEERNKRLVSPSYVKKFFFLVGQMVSLPKLIYINQANFFLFLRQIIF